MKIRTALLISTAAAALSTFGSCENASQKVSVAEPTTSGVTPESIVFDWQSAYDKKISEFRTSADYSGGSTGSRFDLCDITGDGSPELIISPSTGAESECKIFTFSGGNIISLGECGVKGEFMYYPSTRTIGKKYVGKTFEINEFMGIEDNELYSKNKFYNNRNGVSSGGRLTYEIDNETVNVSEYDKKIGEYTSLSGLSVGRKYAFSAPVVNYALHCSESWGAVLTQPQKKLYSDILAELSKKAEGDAAFELCDLNDDDLPELIYSESSEKNAMCHIYRIKDKIVDEVTSSFPSLDGSIFFDPEKKVYFGPEFSEIQPQSLDTGNVSDYRRSDDVIICGRKYLLNDDSIQKAFR